MTVREDGSLANMKPWSDSLRLPRGVRTSLCVIPAKAGQARSAQNARRAAPKGRA